MMEWRDTGQRSPGTRYPEETKELAYQLWAFAVARNCAEVARQLASEEWGGIEITKDTVAYWAREYKWGERAAQDVQAIAPDLRHQAFSELLFAGLDGARYIRRINAGKEAPDKTRVIAAIAAVDRIGFSPVGKGVQHVDATRPVSQLNVGSLSDDELHERESSIGAGRQG